MFAGIKLLTLAVAVVSSTAPSVSSLESVPVTLKFPFLRLPDRLGALSAMPLKRPLKLETFSVASGNAYCPDSSSLTVPLASGL